MAAIGLGRDAQHVADHPAHPGVGAAERLDGGGVVVGLNLEGDFVHARRISRIPALSTKAERTQGAAI